VIPVYIEPGVQVFPDGRERCDKTAAGKRALSKRRYQAWLDAKYTCCLCGGQITNDWTLEHKTSKGTGGGKHDDRQSNLGISHFAGNVRRGSMSLEKYMQFSLEERIAFCQGTVPPKRKG
jgi:5-methylcytosine-specific restriction endonuclease McrA